MRPISSRVPVWVLMTGAVLLEVCGTASLRISHGLILLLPALAAFGCYAGSILLFSLLMERGTGLGVAYAVLTACGLMAATGLSALAFHESFGAWQAAGMVALFLGLVALQGPEKATVTATNQDDRSRADGTEGTP